METPLSRASCGGTHLLYALTILWRVDCSQAYLSEALREGLKQYLRGKVNLDEIVDGSFAEAVLKQLGPYRP